MAANKKESDKKAILPICVLSLLERYTDAEKKHHLTHAKIVDLVEREYGLSVERKAVGRYCTELRERFGYDIVSNRSGTYLNSREFKPSEAKLLVDSIMSNRYIEDNLSWDLIYKVAALVSPYYDPHTDNMVVAERASERGEELFSNIENIDSAINEGCSIVFNLYKYNKGKRTLYKNIEALPKCIVFINNRYYLYCIKPEGSEHWPCYPIDNIENIRKGKKNSLVAKITEDERKQFADMIATDVPADVENQMITFLTTQEIIDRVEEAFGGKDKIKTSRIYKSTVDEVAKRNPNAHFDVKVTVETNYRAFKKFIKQNPTKVLVESPRNIQNWLRAELVNAVELNTDVDARQLSDADKELLGRLSLRGKAIVGEPITMGSYPQGPAGEIAPIEWLPITIKKDRVQLISKYSIEYRDVFVADDENATAHTWKDSELREWLNGEFLENSFTEEELSSLLKFEKGDRVFIPSIYIIRDINYSSNFSIVEATPYADKKWQDEVDLILAENAASIDRDKFESFHRQYKTHYCGLDTDDKDKANIIALSEERPERAKDLEVKSLSVRPVVWVRAK